MKTGLKPGLVLGRQVSAYRNPAMITKHSSFQCEQWLQEMGSSEGSFLSRKAISCKGTHQR